MPNEARDLPSSEEEHGLVRQVQAGDIEAFNTLFRRYSNRVYRQAMSLLSNEAEAEEIMQEVFLTFYERAETFRGEAAFSTWLYRLTVNAALNRLRRYRRRREVLIHDYLPRFRDDGRHLLRPVVDWSSDLERGLVREEARQLLLQAIHELRPVDKSVVVLSELEGLSNRETGDVLGLSVSAVKARRHRARLFLRGRLAALLEQGPA